MPNTDSLSTHPYLRKECRLIGYCRALRELNAQALANPAARAAAYAAAGLDAPSAEEDAEALRRQELYWRRIKPQIVVALTDFAAGKCLDRFQPPPPTIAAADPGLV